jgi:hypothetical protein
MPMTMPFVRDYSTGFCEQMQLFFSLMFRLGEPLCNLYVIRVMQQMSKVIDE